MTDGSAGLTLDCRGLACPMPVLKLSKTLKEVAVGGVVEMLVTDPGSELDLEAYVDRTGHRLLERSEAKGVFRFLVQRTV